MTDISEKQIVDTKNLIRTASQLIHEGKNEQVIRDNFTSHLRIIFPSIPTWILDHILGGESALQTYKNRKATTGFVDNLVGLTAIEYESNLENPAIFAEGYEQVKKYCASLINISHNPSHVMGILSDTVHWHTYIVKEINIETDQPIEANDVTLEEIESIDVTGVTDTDSRKLIEFLLKYIQRIGSRPLDASSIARDLGFESIFSDKHVKEFSSIVSEAFTSKPEYAELIKKLWTSHVSFVVSNGSNSGFDLYEYIREVYILTLGKLICANAIEEKPLLSDDNELTEILNGKFFQNRGLENFIEYDYFGWLSNLDQVKTKLLLAAREIQQDLRAYNFEQIPSEDIFGQIMAQLAARSQRVLLGQEWTPTWLARAIVKNTIDNLNSDQQPCFIDMCCGSGAMILETVRQTKQWIINNKKVSNDQVKNIEMLTHSITGFDIDPLAVMLSKIAWVLAAKDWLNPLGTFRVIIPIYHADSLFTSIPLSEGDEADNEESILKLAEYSINLPKFLISTEWQRVFDAIIDRAYTLAIHNGKIDLSVENISEVVKHAVSHAPKTPDKNELEMLVNFTIDLTEKIHALHEDGRNGIWAFILRNNYRPGLVAGEFNGLVSNPPWLALSKIADNPYKKALTKLSENLTIKPQGSSFLHLEMSTIFLLRSIDRYLQGGASIGCVVPDTVLNGDQHNLFRIGAFENASKPVDFNVSEIWQVDRNTFKNVAAVVFGKKEPFVNSSTIPGKFIAEPDRFTPLIFNRVSFGSRVVWTTQESENKSELFEPATFEQGADIMPRRLFFFEAIPSKRDGFVSLHNIEQGSSPLTFVVNDAKEAKDFRISTPCIVNQKFLYDVLISKLLSPFEIACPIKALLPIKKQSGDYIPLNESELQHNPEDMPTLNVFSKVAEKIGEMDKISTPKIENIWARINYRNKIGKQNFQEEGFIVFTGAGGSDVCSAFLPLSKTDVDKLIIDQTLYWAWVKTVDEALYLSGILNSEVVNEKIKAFQPRGKQGERHVHELAFGLIPPFNASERTHLEVSKMTEQLIMEYHELINKVNENKDDLLQWLNPSKNLAMRRSKLREIIKRLPSFEKYSKACEKIILYHNFENVREFSS